MLQRLYYQSATYLPCGLVKSSVLSLLWGEKEEVRRGDRGQEGTGGTLGQGGCFLRPCQPLYVQPWRAGAICPPLGHAGLYHPATCPKGKI